MKKITKGEVYQGYMDMAKTAEEAGYSVYADCYKWAAEVCGVEGSEEEA